MTEAEMEHLRIMRAETEHAQRVRESQLELERKSSEAESELRKRDVENIIWYRNASIEIEKQRISLDEERMALDRDRTSFDRDIRRAFLDEERSKVKSLEMIAATLDKILNKMKRLTG